MNQEQNNLNQNNYNIQGNNGTANNQSLNNQNQIIGFDQLTGEPIFNSGIESKITTVESKTMEQKKISKGKFILHIVLSFGLWNFFILFIFNFLMNSIVYELFKNNLVIYTFAYNILWILSTVVQIFMTYWFNKFKTVEEYQLRSCKNIFLFIFYILIIYINKANILVFIDYNMILGIVLLVLHLIIIYFFNNKVFNKYWGKNSF